MSAQKRSLEAEQRLASIDNLLLLENSEATGKATKPISRSSFLDSAVEVFESVGHELRIAEIRNHLLDRGIPLPGKGNDANLIAVFQRSDGRIIRVGRGIYDIPREATKFELLFSDDRIVSLGRKTKLGRADDNDIILTDKKVAAHQAAILIDVSGEAELNVMDTKSVTKKNNKNVSGSVFLNTEDTLTLGSTTLTFLKK
jgi:hypothetical protein